MTDPLLRTLSPDLDVVVGTIGFCLIFLELNRPGRILPGALGLLMTLLATAGLVHLRLQPWAAGGFFAAAMVFLLNVWRRLSIPVLALAALAGVIALRELLAPGSGRQVSATVAILCGSLLAVLSGCLSRIAYRARRSKALD